MLRTRLIVRLFVPAFVCAPLLAGCSGGSSGSAGKIKVAKLDDLPQHTYPVEGTVTELIKSEQRIKELAEMIRRDVEDDLARYDIRDATTLQGMYGTLLSVDLLNEDFDSALARIERIRELEDKEAQRLLIGLTARALIDAKRETGAATESAECKHAFKKHLARRTAEMPWKVVEDSIQRQKGQSEILSENLLLGVVQARMEPVVAKTGELNKDMAASVVGMHYTIRERLPLKNETVSVFQEIIDANKTAKIDIWAERSVTLAADRNLEPVLAAVWDSGTDADLFNDRLFVNPNEKLNGMDYDGNGYVDDVHGIAYDMHANRTTGTLMPLGDAAPRMSQVMKHVKGFMDVQAAVDSPEAADLKGHIAALAPSDVQGFLEDLGLAGGYMHGTHVAGIMVEGNPFVRLLIARHSYDYRMVPVARTLEWGRRDGAKCRDTVDYFKQHGVRVVNMSWGEAQKDAESSLEANGIGESAEERREIARQVFSLQREGLYEAIKNAPDILFVCAAGNSDNDVQFDEYIPSGFDLPNLLVVGAVDQAGEPTSFTSSGKTVRVYANGFEVDSCVPGGERLKASGTSMASPNAANLAAKMLAVDPSLKPKEAIKLIEKGADKRTAGSASYLLINPKKTMDLL